MEGRTEAWESMKKEPELTEDNDIISIYKKKTDKRMCLLLVSGLSLIDGQVPSMKSIEKTLVAKLQSPGEGTRGAISFIRTGIEIQNAQ